MTDERPVWLEFFGGEGGTAAGIAAAGFRVICVDLDAKALARNPFETVQADAVSADFYDLVDEYRPAVVGGGPPCQDYSPLKARTGKTYPRLIEPFRAKCAGTGLPYVIENVEAARPFLRDPVMLCGAMFAPAPIVDGLLLKRHRLFESNMPLRAPGPDFCRLGQTHGWWRGFINVHGGGGYRERKGPNGERIGHGNKADADEARALLGTPWMSVAGMNECIPPRYSAEIARQVWQHLYVAERPAVTP